VTRLHHLALFLRVLEQRLLRHACEKKEATLLLEQVLAPAAAAMSAAPRKQRLDSRR
jgi:hypothetical protein